jgi:hypothetical protein
MFLAAKIHRSRWNDALVVIMVLIRIAHASCQHDDQRSRTGLQY